VASSDSRQAARVLPADGHEGKHYNGLRSRSAATCQVRYNE
jgi:hypothetical protein